MTKTRHSYVPFYPSDWLAGTARMTRLHKSVFHDICCCIWDKAAPCPAGELPLMLGDLAQWRDLVNDLVTDLVTAGKLRREADGGLINARALAEAVKAQDLWQRKSRGGRTAAEKANIRRTGFTACEEDGRSVRQNDAPTASLPDSWRDASQPRDGLDELLDDLAAGASAAAEEGGGEGAGAPWRGSGCVAATPETLAKLRPDPRPRA